MDITFSGWGFLTGILYLFWVALCVTIGVYTYETYMYLTDSSGKAIKSHPRTDRYEIAGVIKGLLVGTATLLIGTLVANALVYQASISLHENPRVKTTDLAAHFGMQNGVSYPAELGARNPGSDFSISGGFFGIHGVGHPTSSISVSFAHDNESYILELPTSKITFVQKTDEQPGIRIYLNDGLAADVKFTIKRSPCQDEVHNFFLTCKRHIISKEINLSADAESLGLSPIVLENIKSAQLTLTPEMYRTVLGK